MLTSSAWKENEPSMKKYLMLKGALHMAANISVKAITDKTKSGFRTPVLFSIGETERTGNLITSLTIS